MPSVLSDEFSPVEQFIETSIAPRRHELHLWKNTKKHQDILLEDAQKRRRISARSFGKAYAFSQGPRLVGGMDGRLTTLVSGVAREATKMADMTHDYLRASNVPSLPGRLIHVSLFETGAKYQQQSENQVIIRPASPQAKPIAALAVSTADELKREWDRSADAVAHLKNSNQQIWIEPFSKNLALRIYVVGERAIAGVVRTPFHVIGDGHSTAQRLISDTKTLYAQSSYLRPRRLHMESAHFQSMEISSEEVLPLDAIRVLKAAPQGESGGGLSVDVFDDIHEELRELAIDAMWAFPGLAGTAVDIDTPSLGSADGARVVNVVPTADVGEFLYPAYGEPRRCGVRIFDQMIHMR